MVEECEIAGPIVYKDDARRIAYAAVLVPGEPDSDGEVLSPERVERAAHEWLSGYRNVDLQHSLNNIAVPVESYIQPMNRTVSINGAQTVLPEGTWVLAAKIQDDNTWNDVVSGKLTGYSVMGIRRQALSDAAGKSVALKRTLLRDLGEDWIAAAVSVVDEPAVPKAKFFALKSVKEEDEGILSRIAEAFQARKAGRAISDKNYAKIKAAIEALTEIAGIAENERSGKSNEGEEDVNMGTEDNKVVEALKEKIDAMQAEIDSMKAAKAKEEEEAAQKAAEAKEAAEKAAAEEAKKAAEAEEAFKKALIEKVEALEQRVSKNSAASKSLQGQDGGQPPDVSEKSKRDSFGRVRRGE